MSNSILNDKIKKLTPYEPLQGDFGIRLDANESFISLPDSLRAALAKAAEKVEYNRYPDPLAEDVCKAFAAFFGLDYGLVTAGNGSDELISIIINCFADRGDKVICLSPDFSMYRFYSSLAELKVIELQKGNNLNIAADDIIKTIKAEKPRIVIFSNPCNPTGQGFSREDILKILAECNCLFVLDEAYMDFWNETVLDKVTEYKNLIVLKTCSKAFGLAALRLGFAVCDKELSLALKTVKSPFNVNSLTQEFGRIVLSDKKYLSECIENIKRSRDFLYENLKGLEKEFKDRIAVLPTCTNFVLIKTSAAVRIFEELLLQGIAVRCFNGFLRVTAGSEKENDGFLKAFDGILRKLGE